MDLSVGFRVQWRIAGSSVEGNIGALAFRRSYWLHRGSLTGSILGFE